MKRLCIPLLLLGLLLQDNQATSLVYSLKVRRVFGLADLLSQKAHSIKSVTALPIIYTRKSHIVDPAFNINIYDKRLNGGVLLDTRYLSASSRWWAEATTGLEKETVHVSGSSVYTKSRTGFDDIVFAFGHNVFPNKRCQLVGYVIGGVPTYTKVTAFEAQDTLVGTRFFSAGFGAEGSYSLMHAYDSSFASIVQVRFLHFFDRNWLPTLPKGSKIQPGNVIDLLCSLRYRKKIHIVEGGYNATFFTNEALLLPTKKVKVSSVMRNSCYITYSHVFKNSVKPAQPIILGLGCSASFSTKYHTKIFSVWGNISKLF